MGQNSSIEWTDHTFNAWVGCTKLSAACDFCYAEGWAKRTGHPELWDGERRRTREANWRQPLKWNAVAEADGSRPRVFCCSLADVFDNQVNPKWRADLFDLIRKTANLEWQLLTKRPQNIIKMCEAAGGLPRNAALGTTTEDQAQADIRLPHLVEAAAKLDALYTFVSAEPLLAPLTVPYLEWAQIDWVICGGESGPQARPMHPAWARSLRDQCAAAGVAFFFKQWGEYVSVSEVEGEGPHFSFPDGATVRRLGKKAAGRLLDGVEHNGFPKVVG